MVSIESADALAVAPLDVVELIESIDTLQSETESIVIQSETQQR